MNFRAKSNSFYVDLDYINKIPENPNGSTSVENNIDNNRAPGYPFAVMKLMHNNEQKLKCIEMYTKIG